MLRGHWWMVGLLTLVAGIATGAEPEAPAVRFEGGHGVVEISAERLQRYAEGRPGVSAQRLVDELVEFELLAGEARASGMSTLPEVKHSAAQAMVQMYLREVFEVRWSAKTIPDDMVERAYRKNISFYKHPALRGADHILVGDAGKRPVDALLDRSARALAARIHTEISSEKPKDGEAFRALAERYQVEAASLGLTVRAESLGRFSRTGRYVARFTTACFDVHTVGRLTEVFDTEFGYHIVRIFEVTPAADESLADASGNIRARIVPEVRSMKLRALTETLAERYHAVVNHDPLERLEARREGGVDEE